MPAQAIRTAADRARSAASEVYNGSGGQARANNIVTFIDLALQEIAALEAKIDDGKPMPIRTLREGMEIQRELDRLGWDHSFRQTQPPGTGTPGTYKITIPTYGTWEGTPEQIASVLRLVQAVPMVEPDETPGETWPNGVN